MRICHVASYLDKFESLCCVSLQSQTSTRMSDVPLILTVLSRDYSTPIIIPDLGQHRFLEGGMTLSSNVQRRSPHAHSHTHTHTRAYIFFLNVNLLKSRVLQA